MTFARRRALTTCQNVVDVASRFVIRVSFYANERINTCCRKIAFVIQRCHICHYYDHPLASTPPGMPGTHFQCFGWGTPMGISPNIITYTLNLAPQNSPKYAISRSQNKTKFWRGGTAPSPDSHWASPYLTPFGALSPQSWTRIDATVTSWWL